MRPSHPSNRAFTIVELLVVIAVIAVLTGLILAGLRAAVATASKTKEVNLARGYWGAWHTYSTHNNEELLPGFLDETTQQNWTVTYKNQNGNNLPRAVTQTFPWRLMAEFGGDFAASMLAYSNSETQTPDDEVATDWSPQADSLPAWMQNVWGQPGSAVALQPAFGYNAYYLGGWYETNSAGISEPRFTEADWVGPTGTAMKGRIVARTVGQIIKPAEINVFCSSTYRPANTGTGYKASASDESNAQGSAWVVPGYLGDTQVWSIGSANLQGVVLTKRSLTEEFASMMAPAAPVAQDSGTMVVYVDQSVPLRRFNRQAAVVFADGHTSNAGTGELLNMTHWISQAWKADFRHGP